MNNFDNLKKVQKLDPIIATFTSRELQANPDFVKNTYLDHAENHMSLGDTSTYIDRMLKWSKQNRGAVIGAISGEYGYGKTSIAIHLWQQAEKADIISVPPFEWYNMQDIIDATWTWTRYRLEKIKPKAVSQLTSIYGRYREKSVNQFSSEHEIPVATVNRLVESKQVSLSSKSVDVIDFLSEVSQLLESPDLNLFGPLVFTDELQVTMSRYQEENRSRDEFMQDIFELLNILINRQGSYGLIMAFPLNTETIINNVRADIIQRFQHCKLFIRPNNMYDRKFPAELWDKFAKVFDFEGIANIVIPEDSLDSLGQISIRSDLGAGPRTVIEAMIYAANRYEKENKGLTPIDLIDAYLQNQIAYDASGKLISVVNEILQSQHVINTVEADKVIKLMAAFPMGCQEDHFERYELVDVKDKISRQLFAEYFHNFSEGISLRGLAPSERPVEPIYIQLTRDFIQTYSESERNLKFSVSAFHKNVIKEKLLTNRNRNQIIGWKVDANKEGQYIGTFDNNYPERHLLVDVSTERGGLITDVEEFGLAFWIDQHCDVDYPGGIEYCNENMTQALFHLNPKRTPSRILNIPFVEDMGFPLKKVTPLFMLGLVEHLDSHTWDIPEDERIQIKPFINNLIDYSIELLLNPELLENSEIRGLSKVGLSLPKEIYIRMCRRKYPDYETLITTGTWKKSYATYLAALSNITVSTSVGVLRGNRYLELANRKDVLKLFGENRAQAITALATNLSNILEVELGPHDGSSPSKVRFKIHPAEQIFVDAIITSDESIKRDQLTIRAMDQHKGFSLLQNLGYLFSEIQIIFEMLKCRRLIEFDENRQYFLEVLESPSERSEAIVAQLINLAKQAEILKVTDFDREGFLAVVTKLREQVSTCDDIEKLEDYQEQLIPLREDLSQFSKKWSNKAEENFDGISHYSGKINNAGIPADITRSIQSDVSWVGELVQCQALLRQMYQNGIETFRELDRRAKRAWNKWENTSDYDMEALVSLYEENFSLTTEFKQAKLRIENAHSYLGSYLAWLTLLSISSRAFVDAIGCETSYSESIFRDELLIIFNDIEERFRDKRLEALPDHEMYSTRIKETQEKIEEWLRNRRLKFMESKAFCEEMLKTIGVERFNLHATFDTFDPGASRSSLFNETLEKIQEYVQIIEENNNRNYTEMLYAKQVLGEDVSELKNNIQDAREQLKEIKKSIDDECLRDKKCFAVLGEKVNGLRDSLQDTEKLLRGIFKKREYSSVEEGILEVLQDPRGTDLSLVIASQLAKDPENFNMDNLMEQIASLFKKNQIIISLIKRR